MMNITEKAKALRKQADRLEYLESIYETIKHQMEWDAMKSTNEQGNVIFKAPDPDDWSYERYNVWLEVMDAIEKLAK